MKQVVLFLAANPLGSDQLALDQEARGIQLQLERSGFRDRFELVTRWAVTPLDLLHELSKLRPTIVHFSGHGLGAEPGAAAGDEAGLLLQGAGGQPRQISGEALERAFAAAGASVKLVVLNACYSEQLVAALLRCVPCVIGMRGSLEDGAALAFSIGFYGALGERRSVASAYAHGCSAIQLTGLGEHRRPQLAVRPGFAAEALVLADAPPPVGAPVGAAWPAGAATVALQHAPAQQPQPSTHAVIRGGYQPIIAQHSTVTIGQPTEGQLRREARQQRAGEVSRMHQYDPVGRPRVGVPVGLYVLLIAAFMSAMTLARLIL
jgi:hypothetical protein